jgi:hypothetical protein
MHHFITKALGFLGLGVALIHAGETTTTAPAMKSTAEPRTISIAQEITAEYSYVGGARSQRGNIQLGRVSEQTSGIRYILSSGISDGVLLRLGGNWHRYSFGLPNNAPLPNTLQATAAVIGVDVELSDAWLFRAEFEPGIYSDFNDISFDDVNCPATIGASYLVDEGLQWFFGVSIDLRRDWPVIPGVGVRWEITDQWTLMFLLPKPRIEYEIHPSVTLFAGAEVKAGTFKVDRRFGSSHGIANLNNATLDYTEIRTGGGVSWKVLPALTVDLEGGMMLDREFDFHNAGTRIDSDEAPYGQMVVRADF